MVTPRFNLYFITPTEISISSRTLQMQGKTNTWRKMVIIIKMNRRLTGGAAEATESKTTPSVVMVCSCCSALLG